MKEPLDALGEKWTIRDLAVMYKMMADNQDKVIKNSYREVINSHVDDGFILGRKKPETMVYNLIYYTARNSYAKMLDYLKKRINKTIPYARNFYDAPDSEEKLREIQKQMSFTPPRDAWTSQ